MVGIKGETFKISLNEKYVMGIDPYEYEENSESFSAVYLSVPKRKFGIKRIRGHKRVVELGWEYTIKMV